MVVDLPPVPDQVFEAPPAAPEFTESFEFAELAEEAPSMGADTTTPATTSPAPLPIEIDSPTPSLLTVTACRASAPVIEIRSPTVADTSDSSR